MPQIATIRFRPKTRGYSFEASHLPDLVPGDIVLVETNRGRDMGEVITAPREATSREAAADLATVVRRATGPEVLRLQRFRAQEPEALRRCQTLAREMKLPMKVLQAEYNYDGSRLLYHFSAEGRVDFRDLVRSLARVYHTRIDMHQVGVRDEARLVGDYGICGRMLCCRDWLQDFSKVSIRMAKRQNLSLNPMEISGVCGRLLCCLGYEDEHYVTMRAAMPKRGEAVRTPQGEGVVADVNVIQELVLVRIGMERPVPFPMAEVTSVGRSGGGSGGRAPAAQEPEP